MPADAVAPRPPDFRQGVALHREGKLAEAAEIYRQVLSEQPTHYDALHLSGVIAAQTGDPARAVDAISAAIRQRADDAASHFNLGIALKMLGRFEAALASYDRALALRPDYADAHAGRGNVLKEMQRHEEALASSEQALRLVPGNVEFAIGRATILNDMGDHRGAIATLEQVLQRRPDHVEALTGLASSLIGIGQPGKALELLDRALTLRPQTFAAHRNRGNALHELQRWTEALASYDRALEIDPTAADVYNNRGMTLQAQRRWEEAIASFTRARELRTDYAQAHMNEALCRLQMGDFALGWPAFERRWDSHDYRARLRNPRPPFPIDVLREDARRILVWGEQGVGDQALYASMLPDLLARGCQVTLELDPRLARLFARSFPSVEILARDDPAALQRSGPFDCRLPLASLGQYFRRDAAQFPRHSGYLVADRVRAAALRRRWQGDSGARLIGIAWRSSARRNAVDKSSALLDWQPILRLPNTRFVSLQYGDNREDIEAVRRRFGVEIVDDPDCDQLRDLDDLAAQIAAVDEVVSTSNSTAHFAGAIGAPTLVLLPKVKGLLWYWFVDRSDNPWYPSMTMLRQDEAGEWDGVIARAAARLGRSKDER